MNIDQAEILSTTPDGRPSGDQPAWRREFPIDWPETDYVSRREFTRLLLVTSLAFVVGQVYIVFSTLLRRNRPPLPVTQIAAASELPVNKIKRFHYPTASDPCVLIRLGENEYVAYSQKCTHLSCPVIPNPAAGKIRCPCHEGIYDLRTGDVLAGPPERALPRITLQVRDGAIFATGVQGGAL